MRSLQDAERERTNILFAAVMSWALFVYYEMGRRQALSERREETRREWVDTKIGELEDGALGVKERGEGVRNIGRILAWAAGIVVAIAAALTYLAAIHTI